MRYAIDTDTFEVYIIQDNEEEQVLQFKNRKELISFFCAANWTMKDYEDLFLYSCLQIPLSDMPFLPVRLFAKFNDISRQRVNQLEKEKKLQRRGRGVRWRHKGDPVANAEKTLAMWKAKREH